VSVNRTMVAGLTAVAVITAGCSSSKSPSASSGSQAPSPSTSATASSQSATPSSSAQAGSFDQSTCLDISFAKDNLMVAGKADDARKFADTLEKYGPPDPVKAAIEHFVTTVGAQPTDPGLDANRDQIMGWIKQICPNVNP